MTEDVYIFGCIYDRLCVTDVSFDEFDFVGYLIQAFCVSPKAVVEDSDSMSLLNECSDQR